MAVMAITNRVVQKISRVFFMVPIFLSSRIAVVARLTFFVRGTSAWVVVGSHAGRSQLDRTSETNEKDEMSGCTSDNYQC
jgi:hypothetical protein